MAGSGKESEVPVELVSEELAFEEPELLIPPEEDASPHKLIPGHAPVGKGGLVELKHLNST